VLENVAAILAAGGADLGDVLKVTVYVSDIGLWGRVNQVYAEVFGEHRPARVVVPTRDLHHGFQIEIEAIAAVKDQA
jgi:2-iminobutanoate/2-iminopropanoate deaminase